MIELKRKENPFEDDTLFFDIILDGISVGSLECNIEDECLFIENITRNKQYKGKGILRQVIKLLNKDFTILCLPLNKYKSYYESMGFKVEKIEGEDVYYKLDKGGMNETEHETTNRIENNESI